MIFQLKQVFLSILYLFFVGEPDYFWGIKVCFWLGITLHNTRHGTKHRICGGNLALRQETERPLRLAICLKICTLRSLFFSGVI